MGLGGGGGLRGERGDGSLRSGVYFCNDFELLANEIGDRLNDNEDKVDDDNWREEGCGGWGGGGTEGWGEDGGMVGLRCDYHARDTVLQRFPATGQRGR